MKEATSKAAAGKTSKADTGPAATATDDCGKATAGYSRRSNAVADSGPRDGVAPTALVLVAAIVACTATVDWERAATIYRHWLSATAGLLSVTDEKCSVILPDFAEDILRPPINCSFCSGLDTIEKIFNLSSENFEKYYAYTGQPVVAVNDLSRSSDFGFRLFKNLSNSKLLSPCQFFPYKTEFSTLDEALNMDEQRAEMAPGYAPWYIGWSNCESKTINHLKKHISLPNFLPSLSDSKRALWIFMGTPGHGAPMHIDKVGYPSWQTQISGYKKWTLRTPVECFFQCKREFEVFMDPGSTIVLDTNIWYHKTHTIGHDVSITVGGEYD